MRKIALQLADFDWVARNQIDSDLVDWQEQLAQPFTFPVNSLDFDGSSS